MSIKTLGRSLPNGDYIEARVGFESLGGQRAHFTVSGSLYRKYPNAGGRARKRMGRDSDAGGQITKEIARAFPKLLPVLLVHLADAETGEPMHALENGWYWYKGIEKYGDKPSHSLAAEVLHIPGHMLPVGLGRQDFEHFVEDLRPIWQEQALRAHQVIESLVDGEGVEAVGG